MYDYNEQFQLQMPFEKNVYFRGFKYFISVLICMQLPISKITPYTSINTSIWQRVALIYLPHHNPTRTACLLPQIHCSLYIELEFLTASQIKTNTWRIYKVLTVTCLRRFRSWYAPYNSKHVLLLRSSYNVHEAMRSNGKLSWWILQTPTTKCLSPPTHTILIHITSFRKFKWWMKLRHQKHYYLPTTSRYTTHRQPTLYIHTQTNIGFSSNRPVRLGS